MSSGQSPAAAAPRTQHGASTVPPSTGSPSQHLSGLMCNVHRTTGKEPHPLVGATTTVLGDRLYVFGGRVLSRSKPILTSDLYELDLIRRHWTKIETTGDIPPPRYFHSMCALGDSKLVCYGGMSPVSLNSTSSASAASSQTGESNAQPEVVVMSDIYIYDSPTSTWTFIPTTDTPQGRYAHCATILPSSATFTSASAPISAIQNNPSSGDPNRGVIGHNIDGTGGAQMVIVGGQDSANHYIEQISVFNLRSLNWTSTSPLGKSCGAYRSVVAPIPASVASKIGKSSPTSRSPNPNTLTNTLRNSQDARDKDQGSSMLIYSNYNFLDVKLELQIRSPAGALASHPMHGSFTPPGLRFPNGGLLAHHFIVSGTYLTSSKQEYSIWALDLRSLTWSRIEAGGNVFGSGSWNRGVLWERRNAYVVLGSRKRGLVEDYNHRRLNWGNFCVVELEAFGLYENPRLRAPMSGFVSASSPISTAVPELPRGVSGKGLRFWSAGGRSLGKAAEDLGNMAAGVREICDMDLLAVDGGRIPVNSRLVAQRWGPYFVQLLREGTATTEGNDAATLRPGAHHGHGHGGGAGGAFGHNQSRNSSVTITPGFSSGQSTFSVASTLRESISGQSDVTAVPETEGPMLNLPIRGGASQHHQQGQGQKGGMNEMLATALLPPTPSHLPPTSRPRTLYLPHTTLTLQSLLYFLYTSSLPPPPPSPQSHLCTPQILCSLLQLARPYRIDGLVEAVVERLHGVLDSRNAAAVFNAAAMAAGGGRGIMGMGVGGWLFDSEEDTHPGKQRTKSTSTAGGSGRARRPSAVARGEDDSTDNEFGPAIGREDSNTFASANSNAGAGAMLSTSAGSTSTVVHKPSNRSLGGGSGSSKSTSPNLSRSASGLRINTSFTNLNSGAAAAAAASREPKSAHARAATPGTGMNGGGMVNIDTDTDSEDPASAVSSSAASSKGGDSEADTSDIPPKTPSSTRPRAATATTSGSRSAGGSGHKSRRDIGEQEVWDGGVSSVIGLQKRGLRGLMEGRRLRERGASVTRDGQGGGLVRMGVLATGVGGER
jgi:hypothetical protein